MTEHSRPRSARGEHEVGNDEKYIEIIIYSLGLPKINIVRDAHPIRLTNQATCLESSIYFITIFALEHGQHLLSIPFATLVPRYFMTEPGTG